MKPRSLPIVLRWLLAAAFGYAGYAHITTPGPFLAITPGWVPFPGQVVFWTGIAEIAGALGLLVPPFRTAAAWGLAVYTVCVYPANINHALMDLTGGGGLGAAYHVPRLLFQPVIVWWCLFAGGIVRWPFRAHDASAESA